MFRIKQRLNCNTCTIKSSSVFTYSKKKRSQNFRLKKRSQNFAVIQKRAFGLSLARENIFFWMKCDLSKTFEKVTLILITKSFRNIITFLRGSHFINIWNVPAQLKLLVVIIDCGRHQAHNKEFPNYLFYVIIWRI